jgi:hypothetical protein
MRRVPVDDEGLVPFSTKSPSRFATSSIRWHPTGPSHGIRERAMVPPAAMLGRCSAPPGTAQQKGVRSQQTDEKNGRKGA